MMSHIFLNVVNMSISAGYIVLAVLLLRLLLHKAPKWIIILLWGIAAFRLACPFSVESTLSLIPSAETVSTNIMADKTPAINTGIPIINNAINPIFEKSFTPSPADSANPLQIWIPVFTSIWLIGIVILLIYTAISYIHLRHYTETAVLLHDNIYQSENVMFPFVLGIVKPKIYLPFNIDAKDTEYVIAHEKAHLLRKDTIWKPLGFLLLILHWFNPLVWLGYILFCRDIETACDEKVIKYLDQDERADYSEALLNSSSRIKTVAACPLAFGETDVKKRIKSVVNYKDPTFWIISAALLACIAVAVCFLTSPSDNYYKGPLSCTRFGLEQDELTSAAIIDFTEDAADDIINIINNCKWEEGAFSLHGDYLFELKNARIGYFSDTGILIDQTNGRTGSLDIYTKAKLNKIIGAVNSQTMLIYDSPIYSATIPPSQIPEIEIEDGIIYTVNESIKERLGTVNKVNINHSNFDSFINKYDSFDHSQLAKELRNNNKTAYEVTPGDLASGIGIYYIMEQKNGETLIVYGHYDNGKKENEIRFIYSIASHRDTR